MFDKGRSTPVKVLEIFFSSIKTRILRRQNIRATWYNYSKNLAFRTHFRSVVHSYRNQSIDLQRKSIDWFLYECNIDLIWVDHLSFKQKYNQSQ